jgi:hypothetical protein
MRFTPQIVPNITGGKRPRMKPTDFTQSHIWKERPMKKRMGWFSIGLLLSVLLLGRSWWIIPAHARETTEEGLITVLNPRGKAPPIPLVPMAPRLDTLEGKTIYFVDVRFPGGNSFLREMMNWFAENKPGVKTVLVEKTGPYMDGDPKLWAEIKKKGDAMIMAIGH